MDKSSIASLCAAALIALSICMAAHRTPRNGGRNPYCHLGYAIVAVVTLLFLPRSVLDPLTSPLGVCVVGTAYPIFESIRAVCTPGTADDTTWLQYWIAQAALVYSTEWIDDLDVRAPEFRRHWYQFEFFFFLWLLLPVTDGASLVFDYVTEPFLAPWVKPLAKRCEGWISALINLAVNASHLWLLWAAFVFFPAFLKRFIVVSFGTLYPLAASVVAVTTREDGEDDKYWLTYWSCYGTLFTVMDWVEAYLGKIPGFYSLVLFAIAYLMLPLFRGAEQVFRSILVPLAGQTEMLLVRDALQVKKEMEAKLPADRLAEVTHRVAASFAEDGGDGDGDGGNEGGGSSSGATTRNRGGYQSINDGTQEEIC